MADEERWLAEAREGSIDAFSELVRLHQSHVCAYLGRFTRNQDIVEDLAQEVFLTAYQTIARYEGKAPFRIWLFGMARNLALAFLRKEARRRSRESNRFEAAMAQWRMEEAEREDIDAETSDREIAALAHCLKSLPRASAHVVSEYYFEARSAVQIAGQLQRKVNGIRKMLFRIRRSLRRCIQQKIAPEGL